jgi:hypothetical protein
MASELEPNAVLRELHSDRISRTDAVQLLIAHGYASSSAYRLTLEVMQDRKKTQRDRRGPTRPTG